MGSRFLQKNLGLVLFSVLLAPRCSCDDDRSIDRVPVEMRLTLLELDPCSGAPVARRIPDDYVDLGLTQATDFGSKAERTFEVRSVGTAQLTVSEVRLSEDNPEFVLELMDAEKNPIATPIEIAPDSDPAAPPGLIIKVSYQASDSTSDLLQLIVKSDDPDREEVAFNLSAGRGRLQICGTNGCTSPDGADCGALGCTETPEVGFGDVSQGDAGDQVLVLKNVGEGDLDLRNIKLETASGEFCAPEATEIPESVQGCSLINLCKVLKPGESYEIHISYTPVDGGTDSGVIRVTSGDASLGTIDVPVSGRGAGPGLCVCYIDELGDCVDAQNIDFGFADVMTTIDQTVRIVSCGTEPVDLNEATLETDSGNPFFTGPEFSISTPFATGLIQPTEYVEGVVSYSPLTSGTHRGGLRYGYAGAGSKSWVPLIGRAATCDLEAFPQTVNFGSVGSGAFTDRIVALVNSGQKDCSISAITDPTDPSFVIQSPPGLPVVVPPGGSLELSLRYTSPMRPSPMPDMATFDVTSNEPAPNDVNTVTLQANGGGQAVCDIQVNPNNQSLTGKDGTLQFGAVNIGYDKTLSIRINNVGTAQCNLDSFNLVAQSSDFTAAAVPPTPAAFGPGQSASIDVTFSPSAGTGGVLPIYASFLNYVDFRVSGPGVAQTDWSIGITAQPTIPTIDILPDSLDFGVVTWENPQPPDMRSSCGSEERAVRIYNSGTGPLDITSMFIDPSSDPVFMITQVLNAGGSPVNAPYAMTVPAGQNAEVKLRFFPTRLNPSQHSGLLVVENNVTMQSTVPLLGESTANSNQTDQFAQLTDNKVDILWVVDDSGSMGEEQNLLANNFGNFVSFADSEGVDYQIGVVTTEVNDAPAGKIWACNGFNKIITSSDPNRFMAFQCAANVTNPPNGNSPPNPMGSDEQEAGLQAARIALDAPLRDDPMFNGGFLRDDARLAVIIVSDEEDQSNGSVNLYVDFFRNLKGFRNPQLVSLSAIAGDVPNGCATAEAGHRYYDAAQQLNGQFESICASSWQNMLNNIGLGVFALRTAWNLSRPADPNSIVVRVNGAVTPMDATNGWTFDNTSNSIEFHGSQVPPPGGSVEIQYSALCLP